MNYEVRKAIWPLNRSKSRAVMIVVISHDSVRSSIGCAMLLHVVPSFVYPYSMLDSTEVKFF